jgi:hypothetical protein
MPFTYLLVQLSLKLVIPGKNMEHHQDIGSLPIPIPKFDEGNSSAQHKILPVTTVTARNGVSVTHPNLVFMKATDGREARRRSCEFSASPTRMGNVGIYMYV